MRFSYFGSGKFSVVDLVFYYYLAGVFDIDKTHLELTICPRHRDMFEGTKGFSITGKLSPAKIPSSRLASPGCTRMGQKELCCLEFMVFALQHSSQRRTRYYPFPDQAAHRFIVFNVLEYNKIQLEKNRKGMLLSGTFATTWPKSVRSW